MQLSEDTSNQDVNCDVCNMSLTGLNNLEKLQHIDTCNMESEKLKRSGDADKHEKSSHGSHSGLKKYDCHRCNKKLYLTSIEILKHKKHCIKIEK